MSKEGKPEHPKKDDYFYNQGNEALDNFHKKNNPEFLGKELLTEYFYGFNHTATFGELKKRVNLFRKIFDSLNSTDDDYPNSQNIATELGVSDAVVLEIESIINEISADSVNKEIIHLENSLKEENQLGLN